MESLAPEIAPFGIHTTIVNPGFFRTELLTEQSTKFAETTIPDYDERRSGSSVEFWKSQNGKQGGDPAKLARALLTITEPAAFAAPLHRRRRLDRIDREGDRHTSGAGRRVPQPVDVAWCSKRPEPPAAGASHGARERAGRRPRSS